MLAELLVRAAPELYRPYITIERGHTVLYVELLNALYGMIVSALLFYKKLIKDLKQQDFVINPYDPCVANKIVNNKQLTIVWHVDDLKISHEDPQVVTEFLIWLKATCAKDEIGKVKTSRGKIHDYLGMKIDYSSPVEVKFDMSEYVTEMIKEFGEDINHVKGKANTPAAEYLFKVNAKCNKLEKTLAEKFHTFTAKGLFLCKRARPDIQTTIAFLRTRVKEPDEDDYKKLIRMIKYLQNTKNLVLTIKADATNIYHWYIDAAFGLHKDYRSHTGAALMLNKGSATSNSLKQKLNTRNSPEAEVVAVDDVIPQVLWTNYFMEAQGYISQIIQLFIKIIKVQCYWRKMEK